MNIKIVNLLVSVICAIPLMMSDPHLALASSYTTNGNGGAVDVGTWTMPYSDVNGSIVGYNSWQNYGMNYLPLENWTMVSGNPLPYISGTYGQYNSNDTSAIDRELAALASAKIDFLVIDLTNNYSYNIQPGSSSGDGVVRSAAVIAGEVAKWNANNGIPSGTGNNWQIKYAVCVNPNLSSSEQLAQAVWQGFVSPFGSGNYYQINGLAMLMFFGGGQGTGAGSGGYSSNFFFTNACSQGPGQWGWEPNPSGTQVDPDGLVEQVSPGWFNHYGNIDWVPRNDGNSYANDWNVVFNNTKPRAVFITALDDWQEDQAIWNADTTSPQYLPSNISDIYQNGDTSGGGARLPEVWTMPDGFVHNDGYWNYTASAINYLRNGGTPPSLPHVAPNLALTGTVTASSSISGWPASAVNDGNPGSVYSSQRHSSGSSTEWVQIHMPSKPTFNTVVLMGRGDVPNCFPVSFQIQVLNGKSWVTRVKETNFPQPSLPGEPIAFTWGAPDTATDVRVYVTQLGADQSGGSYLQLSEFMVLNETGTSTAPMFDNYGFEAPALAGGGPNALSAYQYAPFSSGWTFSGGAGVQVVGSAWSSAMAPQGIQTGFLQGTGTISQTINLPSGIYCINFLAAQRIGTGNAQGINVSCDSTNIGSFNPVNSSGRFTPYTTNTFTSSGGNHTFTFAGTGYGGGDDTAFIDQVQIFQVQGSNLGFETPALSAGAFQYGPTGTGIGWTFNGTSGVTANNSGFTSGNPSAPQGGQVGFIQRTGSIQQAFSFQQGTNYTLTFQSAQRGNFTQSNQTIQISCGSSTIATVTPTGTSYGTYTVTFNIGSNPSGDYKITFAGTNATDSTAFIDDVQLAS